MWYIHKDILLNYKKIYIHLYSVEEVWIELERIILKEMSELDDHTYMLDISKAMWQH